MGPIQQALGALGTLPTAVIYIVLAVGAALENVVPIIPADAFVLVGGLLAASGITRPWVVFLLTWLPNVASAAGVYFIARRFGPRFFKMPIARWLLREHQLEQMSRFYLRWGVPTIFAGRLLPGWRAMVPVFAGVAKMPPGRVLAPLLLSSALWYGMLVWLGVLAGRNLPALAERFSDISRTLLWIGLVLLVLVAAWWWRTRHPRED